MEETAVVIVGLIFIAAFGFALIGVPLLFVKLGNQAVLLAKAQSQLKELIEKLDAQMANNSTANNTPSINKTEPVKKPEPVADPLGLFSETPGDFSGGTKQPNNPWQASDKTPEPSTRAPSATEAWATKPTMTQPASTVQKALEVASEKPFKPASKVENSLPAWWQKLVDKLLAMNVTAQVGAVVLIFGTIFLGKYASDIGILTLNAKLALMAIASVATATVGVVFYQRLKVYGEILQGTGFAGWLVTLFIAHVLNEQFHWLLILLLGVSAVALLSYRAWKQNSQALAMVGYLGGFLTPFIAASDVSSLWRLFAYISVLNVGVVLVAIKKPWRWLTREAYVGSFVLLALLMIAETLQRDLANLQIQLPMASFAIVSLMLFSIIAWQWLKTAKLQFTRHISGILFAVPASSAVALQFLFSNDTLYTAASFGLVALWYAALWFKSRYLHFAAISVLFISAAIPFALNDGLTSVIYALEGAAFVYWGVLYNKRSTFVFGWLVQIAAAAFAFRLFQDIDFRTQSIALSWFIYGAVAVSGLVSARLIQLKGMPFKAYQLITERVALAWSLFFVIYQFGFWLAESYSREITLLGLIYVLAGLFVVVQISVMKIKWPALADYTAPLFSGFLIMLFSFLLDYASQTSLLTLLLLSVLLLSMLGFRLILAKNSIALNNWDAFVTWFAGALALSILFSELLDFSSDWNFVLASLPWLLLCVFIVPLQQCLFKPNKLRQVTRNLTLAVVAVIGTLSFFNLGNFAPLPFWPLLNPLVIISVLAAGLLYRWFHRQKMFRIGILIWLGVALTCEINRILFHYFGIAYHPESWLESALAQMVWSLVWVVMGGALMISAARIRNCRSHWYAGAAVLALIVLKLFVLDLANVDTLFRIISFIGVGVLLLAIGYVAPLPKLNNAGEAKE